MENPFRWVPTIKHIATGKIVEVLWRNADSKSKTTLKKLFQDYYRKVEGASSMERFNRVLFHIINDIETAVRQLPLPDLLHSHVIFILVPMMVEFVGWLFRDMRDVGTQFPEDAVELTNYFVDHTYWRNLGCIDAPKMYKCYLRHRETIPFGVWHQLCYYCLEEEIIQFGQTIDWDHCNHCMQSPYCVYWYHKISGEFPSEEMIASLYFNNFLVYCREGTEYERSTLKNILRIYAQGPSISACEYFQSFLADGEFIQMIKGACCFISTEASLYLLRKLDGDECFNLFSPDVFLKRMWLWPGILFFDAWVFMFERIPQNTFISFFIEIKAMFSSGAGVFSSKLIYEPFEKIWNIFYERFSESPRALRYAFWNIYVTHDVTMCKTMFKELRDDQRKRLIRTIIDNAREDNPSIHSQSKFLIVFCQHVLEDDEERQWWMNMWAKYL